VSRNEDYWQTDADGNPLPYLDSIEFRPVPDGPQRVTGVQTGNLTIMHTSAATSIVELRDSAEGGDIGLVESDSYGETGYWQLNTAIPPFDNKLAREAAWLAYDRETYNQIQNQGILTPSTGPFAPGNMGNLDDSGLPEFDLEAARAKVEEYETETGQSLEFAISSTNDPTTLAGAQLFQQMLEDAGMSVSIRSTDQAQLINEALAGDFQMNTWRNHPGGDPDTQYVWWKSGSPVNFGKITDTEIDRLLDEGRVSSDEAERTQIYEDLNRRFASELYNLWSDYTLWAIGTATNVHGVFGPNLPDETGQSGDIAVSPGLGTGHPLLGLYVSE
jgi:peptide/nickel transport system substrate-binding protein